MENSSSSKTRSPARVLAALLAVVMLFIVMPVLPAGAAAKVNNIIFKDATADGQYVFFDPEDTRNYVNKVTATEPGNNDSFTWSHASDLTAIRLSESSDVKVMSTNGFGLSFGEVLFEFALYAQDDTNASAYYATSAGEDAKWLPLTPVDTVSYNHFDCKVYAIPQGDMQSNDIYIKVMSSYTATFSIGSGVTVSAGLKEDGLSAVRNSDKLVVPADGLYLTATASGDGYEAEITVSDGAELAKEPTEKGNRHIQSVTGDFTITVNRVKKSLKAKITFGGDTNGFGIIDEDVNEGDNTVFYGDSFSFTVLTTAGYNDPTVEIKQGAENYTGSKKVIKNGASTTYTIYSVTADLDITITAGKKQTHVVTFPNGAENGFTIECKTDLTKVEYDTEITFTLKRSKGWSGTPKVTANGSVVTPSTSNSGEGTWTYSYTVKGNTDFAVTGLTQNTYRVSIAPQPNAFTLSETTQTAHYGDSVTFTLTLSAGWEAGTITLYNDKVKYENVKIDALGDSAYVITITVEDENDLTLTVGGITQKELQVKVKDAESEDAKFELTGGEKGVFTVTYGKGVDFTVTAKTGYTIESVTATTNGNTEILTPYGPGRNQYSVTDVTDDVTVTVSVRAFTITIEYRVSSSVTQVGDTQTGGSLSIEKKYTIESDEVTNDKGTYKLTLATATRAGWTLEGWENEENSVPVMEFNFKNFTDMNVTFNAKWVVDTSVGTDNAFFKVTCEASKDSGVTTFNAHVNTNLSATDISGMNSNVSVVAYGFFYANQKEKIESLSQATADTIKQLKDATARATTKYGSTANLYFYKFATAASSNALNNGATFTFRLSGTGSHDNWHGAAWVILNIEGTDYLFVSTPNLID